MSQTVRTSQLTVQLGGKTIVRGVDLDIPEGQLTVIIGPNGCGKSTLLKSLCRVLEPHSGQVFVGDTDAASLSRKQLSRSISLMAQSAETPEGITVRELVGRGRFPYQSWLSQWSAEDEAAVDAALERANLTELADHRVQSLSGGQRQRAWLGMVLAQETPLILLDEPTTFLDIGHQHALLNLVTTLKEDGRTIVAVLHDLQQAIHYADHIVVMNQGEIVGTGAPRDIIVPSVIREVFEMDAEVTVAGQDRQVVVLPRQL